MMSTTTIKTTTSPEKKRTPEIAIISDYFLIFRAFFADSSLLRFPMTKDRNRKKRIQFFIFIERYYCYKKPFRWWNSRTHILNIVYYEMWNKRENIMIFLTLVLLSLNLVLLLLRFVCVPMNLQVQRLDSITWTPYRRGTFHYFRILKFRLKYTNSDRTNKDYGMALWWFSDNEKIARLK